MRRWLIAAALFPALGVGQVWEKPVAPGLVYRMEVDLKVPRVVHALRFSRAAPGLALRPELAQGTVYGREDDKKGREPLSVIAQSHSALAAVNGDFFPWTGDPLGAMVRNGELVSRPFKGRAAFGWGPQFAGAMKLEWTAEIDGPGVGPVAIQGLNEECGPNQVVLNTGWAGGATGSRESLQIVLDWPEPLAPVTSRSAQVVTVVESASRIPVGRSQAVVTANGTAAQRLKALKKGDTVKIKVQTTGVDWGQVDSVIAGGPMLVLGGKAVDESKTEGFGPEFAERRHPRTAIGATLEGDVWLVVIEGRQPMSSGATISETAKIMADLGCSSAINLDGGGSSQLWIRGMTTNRPSDGTERPIANALLVLAPEYAVSNSKVAIKGLAQVAVGQATDLSVVDEKGRRVPNSQVVWSAMGDAWIDQSGRLRGIAPGSATVQAWVQGQVARISVRVVRPGPKASE